MARLTPMQAAYWTGRQSTGVAAHLYVELDGGGIDPARLADAVRRLSARHPMLRLRLTPEGQPMVVPFDPRLHGLTLDDLTCHAAPDQALATTRARMTHQALALDRGQAAYFRLSLLPGGHRLHVDLDMIAADPSCFGQLMDDLARFYTDPAAESDHLRPCYLDLVPPAPSDPGDRDWWRRALADLPDAPPLPAPDGPQDRPRSTSLSAQLRPSVRAALKTRARRVGVTPSMLALALFARVLADQTGCTAFRLTMPGFARPPQHPHGALMVGDFSGLTVLAVRDALSRPLDDLARDLSRQLAAMLSHSGWPAVWALRDLSRAHGRIEASPVVFTAGLGLRGGSILTPRARAVLGRLGWAVSQGPGVALDVQLAEEGEGLLLNWDLRLDMVNEAWASRAFARHLHALEGLEAATLDEPPKDAAQQRTGTGTGTPHPLGSLARAYLLGRGDLLPLGAVAMQEFREYRGAAPAAQIAARMAALVAAHPALRCRIDAATATARLGPAADQIETIDLGGLGVEAAKARVEADREAFAHQVGDLSVSPWALRLYRLPKGAADATVAWLRIDALLLDGFGIARIARQLFDTSTLPAAPTPAPNPAPSPEARSAAEAWWRTELADAAVPPRLPWRRAPDQIRSSRYARRQVALPAGQFAALRRIAARAGLMPNSLLATLILDCVARWTPDLALCVAMPVAPPAEGALANRSSFVAIRHDAAPGTLPQRGAALQSRVAGALSHLAFSGVDLTRLLLSPGGEARIALPVVLTNGLGWDTPLPDAAMRLTGGLTQTPQVALDIRLSRDAAGNLVVAMDYAAEALDSATVQDMLEAVYHALHMVAEAGALPDCLPVAPPLAPAAEPARPVPYLARIAARLDDPEAGVALIQNGAQLSYGDLARRVRALIAGLRARGLAPGAVVTICLPRGADHLALQIAAAFEGLVWLPIDAASPPERLAYLIGNSRAALVIGDPARTKGLPEGAMTADDLAETGGADRIAFDLTRLTQLSAAEGAGYILYTSGTTGRPKGVVLSNCATANVLGATLARWQIGPDDVVMSVTPLHHDMSVFDLFGALAAGAAIVMPEDSRDKDAAHWAQLVAAHGVTVWVSVPAILDMLTACASDTQLATLRLVAQGGDYVRPAAIADLRRRLPGCRLWSLGGPTETTIWSIWHEITDSDRQVIPYGRALPGNSYHVLDPLSRPCPAGVTGRIHSAGINLALGYLHDGTLAQTDFVSLDQPKGGPLRLFRSGDLGWRRADGTIIFAGRVDGYVKIRGIRVSLPDITAALAGHPQVQAAAVVDLPDPVSGEAVLGAAFAATAALALSDLRAFLRARLPASHLPTRMLQLDRLPLSANGKPDRAAIRAALCAQTAPPADSSLAAQAAVICAATLSLPAGTVREDSLLVMLGLLPRHLPGLARAAAGIGVNASAAQLAACRTPGDIARLTATVGAD